MVDDRTGPGPIIIRCSLLSLQHYWLRVYILWMMIGLVLSYHHPVLTIICVQHYWLGVYILWLSIGLVLSYHHPVLTIICTPTLLVESVYTVVVYWPGPILSSSGAHYYLYPTLLVESVYTVVVYWTGPILSSSGAHYYLCPTLLVGVYILWLIG